MNRPNPEPVIEALRPHLPGSGPALLITRQNFSLAAALPRAFPTLDWEILSKEDGKGRGARWILGRLRQRRRAVVVLEDQAAEGYRRQDLYRGLLAAAAASRRLLVLGEGSPPEVIPVGRWREAPSLAVSLLLDAALSLAAILAGWWMVWRTAPRPPRPLPHATSFVYLRTEFWFGTKGGGSTSHTFGFLSGAGARGHRPRVLASDPVAALPVGVTQTVIAPPARPRSWDEPAMILYNLRVVRRARRLLADDPPVLVVHRHGVFSLAGLLLARALDRPLILEVNGPEVWVRRHWSRLHLRRLAEAMELRALRGADRVTAVSRTLADQLAALGVSRNRIVVNPNGVDVSRFDPGDRAAGLRSDLGFEENDLVVGFSGTFTRWHGALFLGEQIPALAALEPRLKFLLLGDGDLRGAVEQQVRDAGVAARCVFTGMVSPGDIPRHLAACDVLVSPHLPLEDGSPFFFSPVKLFEYMAAGRAVVASRLGQIGEVLEDGVTGILHEAGDADRFREAVLGLAADPLLRARLGQAARSRAETDYTWIANAGRALAPSDLPPAR